MIWLSLIFPVLVMAWLYLAKRESLVWWEALIGFGVTPAIVGLIYWGTQTMQTNDTEWLGTWTKKLLHQEEWVEEQEIITTDEDGNTTTTTHYTRHPEYWAKIGVHGGDLEHHVTKAEYNRLKKRWGNEKYIDLIHWDKAYFGGRGDQFIVKATGGREKMDDIVWTQTYENRVQASRSTVFQFPKVPEKVAKTLFELPMPDKNKKAPPILGPGGPTMALANKELALRNAELGAKKQVRMWILVFKDRDRQSAIDQESLWKGGNKNEFTLCIGINKSHKVQWAYVISWTKVEKLKVDVRQFVQGQDALDLNAIVKYMSDEVEKRFIRKPFAEFSYLTVEPPEWAVWSTLGFVLMLNIGIGFYAALNQFTEENPYGEKRYGMRYSSPIRFRRRYR